MLENILFLLFYLHVSLKSVPLQCVFHSIRFKVNKGWSKALLLFLCLYLNKRLFLWLIRVVFHSIYAVNLFICPYLLILYCGKETMT